MTVSREIHICTIGDFLRDRADGLTWSWYMPYLPTDPQSVIVLADRWAQPRDVHSLDEAVPVGVRLIGLTGLCRSGCADWMGWDLDVGHGKTRYDTLEEAVAAAHTLRNALSGDAEIRLSKSGKGVHVRHYCKPVNLSNEKAVAYVKALAKTHGILADPSPMARQVFWTWSRDRAPRSFELIAADLGLEALLAGE